MLSSYGNDPDLNRVIESLEDPGIGTSCMSDTPLDMSSFYSECTTDFSGYEYDDVVITFSIFIYFDLTSICHIDLVILIELGRDS